MLRLSSRPLCPPLEPALLPVPFVSLQESVTDVDMGAESGRKRGDELFLEKGIPGRGGSLGKEHRAQGIVGTGWGAAEVGGLKGSALAEGWAGDGDGERASTGSSGVWTVPGDNGEPLKGFNQGQATPQVAARRVDVTTCTGGASRGGGKICNQLVPPRASEPEPQEGQSGWMASCSTGNPGVW